jgi:hypothetical protein
MENELVEKIEVNESAITIPVKSKIEELMETAKMLSKSTIVPVSYQNRPENVFIAMDMADRMGVSVMMVMQNLYVVQGKPSFSGSAIASMLNASPKLKNVELNYVGEEGSDDFGAYVTAERSNGKVIKGGTVTIAIAKKEGWYQKAGSKWQTMPVIMLAYRAYAWFGRVYAPELLMGMQSVEEVYDVGGTEVVELKPLNPYVGKEITE